MSSEGILYVATGPSHLEEATTSARAGRPHAGGRPIAIMTDDRAAAEATGVFDLCLEHPDPRHSYRDKIPGLAALPFDRTLFLDSDARLVARVDGVFALLENHDLAAAHAPVRIPAGWQDHSIPDAFPELNSGVLLLRRGPRQEELVQRWLNTYDQVGQGWDQATLRTTAWNMMPEGLKVAVLPPEANLRTTKPWIAGKGLPVTVVHGRVPAEEWAPLLEYLNGDTDRFRTSTEWLDRNPNTALTPRVAPSRRTTDSGSADVPAALESVDLRWPETRDEPLPCEDPIFILSAGWQSGSTILQGMLAADPTLMIWSEALDRARIIQHLASQWLPFTDQWPSAAHQAPSNPGVEPQDEWIANRSPEVNALRQAHRGFLDRLFGVPAREAGRPRWGLKEVRLDANHAAYLKWLYPGARFLLLVRDPFAAYASGKQRGPWHFNWPEAPVEGPQAFGAIWSRLATGFHEFSADASAQLLRYEDLGEQVEAIRAHLGASVVADPADLPVPGGNGPLGFLERRRLAASTARARTLLGYDPGA